MFRRTHKDMTSQIHNSELILNADGSIFHLHLSYHTLADNVILVGDPSRVALFSSMLNTIEASNSNREFVWCTGTYQNTRVTILSTGIGSDNIDIVLNELDAVANIDFESRTIRKTHRTLNIIRIGTCGAIQEDISTGEVIISELSIGIDALLHFYEHPTTLFREDITTEFIEKLSWNNFLPRPYVVESDKTLIELFSHLGRGGITVTAPGFYAPQGRTLRAQNKIKNLIGSLKEFRSSYTNNIILNLEMESAPVAALSKLLNHKAITLCVAIAQRSNKKSDIDYTKRIEQLASDVLTILTKNS